MFKTLIDIIASPAEAFAAIRQKPTILLPLLLVLASTASIQLGYFSHVDFDFMVDELVEQASAVSPAPESELRAAYENSDPDNLAIISAISVVVVLILITAIYAGYLNFVSKFSNDEIGYRHWFSLVAWTSIPAVFVALAAWVVLLRSTDGMISQEQLMPFSLNNLIFQTEGPFRTLLNSLNLSQFWSLALVAAGYRQWTGKSPGASLIVALVPYALVYGVWAIFILT